MLTRQGIHQSCSSVLQAIWNLVLQTSRWRQILRGIKLIMVDAHDQNPPLPPHKTRKKKKKQGKTKQQGSSSNELLDKAGVSRPAVNPKPVCFSIGLWTSAEMNVPLSIPLLHQRLLHQRIIRIKCHWVPEEAMILRDSGIL
jgi:hypothetical protein